MSKKKNRSIVFYKDYFEDFFLNQRSKVQAKILWTLELIEDLPIVPKTYLKRITGIDNMYEVRVQQGNDIFRILCFFDEGSLVVLMNGFQKKTQKTPKAALEKAISIKKQYESERK